MSKSTDQLSQLPDDLLIQDILARLTLPSLGSCLMTSKHLNHTIKSSALLEYSMKLQAMGMIDNPAKSYGEVSLDKRLESLKEYRERWQNFNWQWKTSAIVPPRLGDFQTLKGEAGVVYVGARDELDVKELYSATLPSSKDQAIEWATFRLATPNASIAAYALSIEENDLLACATYCYRVGSGANSYAIQVHLVQHSTQLPYPGLSSPILDVCRFDCQEDGHDYPVINLAIHGTNLVVMVGRSALQEAESPTEFDWMGHLSFWNWKTGEKKGERKKIPDKHKGLVFLREDVLVHGSSLDLCLDIYHIPVSTPPAGDSDIRLIERLGLPKIKQEFRDDLLYDVDISFGDNPTSVTSFTECFDPKTIRLFTTNSVSSIMVIDLMIQDKDQMSQYFSFITHHRALLDRADAAIQRHENGSEGAPSSLVQKVLWEEWGPEATRMFYRNERYSDARAASYGTRYFVQRENEIEVFDFCNVGSSPDDSDPGRSQQKETDQSEDQKPGDLRPYAKQGDDPACQGDCLEDVVHTKLPFVCHTFENKIEGIDMEDWEVMYVDQSRIVGLKHEEIDVLYLG